ncbi:hypothetical protein Lalb_Chr05g0227251 [Lupinus albus]|uniref:Uncharacterized protein n=1 Tax=Lupinus albus TaxID=3870 RepID=A0A6A4QMY4_LUPAL|nr:hypothetical protein Lalb_Chr05g0227251 [Lupinus albus]
MRDGIVTQCSKTLKLRWLLLRNECLLSKCLQMSIRLSLNLKRLLKLRCNWHIKVMSRRSLIVAVGEGCWK